eukprot:6074195-Prymnesium_polylepis.1
MTTSTRLSLYFLFSIFSGRWNTISSAFLYTFRYMCNRSEQTSSYGTIGSHIQYLARCASARDPASHFCLSSSLMAATLALSSRICFLVNVCVPERAVSAGGARACAGVRGERRRTFLQQPHVMVHDGGSGCSRVSHSATYARALRFSKVRPSTWVSAPRVRSYRVSSESLQSHCVP